MRDVRVISPVGSSTMLIVTWLPPALPNGVITSYDVELATSATSFINGISSDTLKIAFTRLGISLSIGSLKHSFVFQLLKYLTM